jgi:RNA polymerase sigma factor (sigma-70 family)
MRNSAEQAAIEVLSKRLRGPLRRFFEKRIGRHHAEIEDLIQEVFVRLAATSARLDAIHEVEAYLFRIATNLLRDRYRWQLSQTALAQEPYEESVHGNVAQTISPEREALGREAMERLIAALYGLPERTRSVWVLYHFEEMPHVEIARQLGMALRTVAKHMKRANVHLLKALDKYE